MREKQTLYFDEKPLRQEFQHVCRYFDITKRSIPAPYFPPQQLMSSENALLDSIEDIDNTRGLSLYIHIPFCDGKCTFCDLYCFHVPRNKRDIIDRYIRVLLKEIQFWNHLFDWKQKPVTTIHFGGGSPLIIPKEGFEKVLEVLHQNFNVSSETEIAVEITTSQISQENISLFQRLHIHRIHIGIQTLVDDIRKIIGRRETSNKVHTKLQEILSHNFILSVDMLYGLPTQTMESFKGDLYELMDCGVDGFALYELNIPPAFDRIISKNPSYQIDKMLNYQMAMTGKSILNKAGYLNVFFNHYGNDRDKNLYFTFPMRGEDCLAFGTIADAKLGKVAFRHKKLKKYMDSINSDESGIDWSYIEDERRMVIGQLETDLMSTCISVQHLERMIDTFGHSFKGIFDIIIPSSEQGEYQLTGSGCWLLSTMLDQLRRLGR